MAKSKNDSTPKNPKRVQPLTDSMGDFDPYRPYFGLLDFLDPRSYSGDQRFPYNPFFPEGLPNGMLSAPPLDDDYSYYTRPNQSVMEQNAAYNAFRQNYERSQSENIRESARKRMEQRINRGYREPIIQPSAPQFVFPIKNGYDGRPVGKINPDGWDGRGVPPPKMPNQPSAPGGGLGGRVPLPMPGTRVPPSSGKFEGFVPLPYPGNPGIRNPHTPIQPLQPPNAPRPSQPSPKPPIYKSPPTGGVFGPQPPIDLSDKLPPRVSGFQPAGADKLPPRVVSELAKNKVKKPTLNSFIPRYERD